MPKKPIKEGYKIFGIADHGYLYNFFWSSKSKGYQDMLLRPSLTKTGCLVRNLALSLPRRRISIYMDNYFTSVPLFKELRVLEYGAIGTTRPHKEFPTKLKQLKKYTTKLEWNTLLGKVVDNTLCLAWQDNNIVLALSTIHTIHKVDDFREKLRKRPGKTSTNARIVRQVFDGSAEKELQIPRFIDDYNQYMGGVDLANQFRKAYETHQITRRNWWPLFYWLIDVACINSYRLYQLSTKEEKPLTHLQFRIKLYCKLLDYSCKAKLCDLRNGLGGKRLFGSELQHLHYWEKRQIRASCIWCQYESRCRKVLGKEVGKGRVKRSVGGCVFCDIPLCSEGHCWVRFHSEGVD